MRASDPWELESQTVEGHQGGLEFKLAGRAASAFSHLGLTGSARLSGQWALGIMSVSSFTPHPALGLQT